MRHEHLAQRAIGLVPKGRAGLWRGAAQLGHQRHPALASMTRREGMGACIAAVEGATTKAVFEAYDVEEALAPSV
jgi:hypothetical protein